MDLSPKAPASVRHSSDDPRPAHARLRAVISLKKTGIELIWALMVFPLIIVLLVLFPLFHLSCPLVAEAARAGGRTVGAQSPSAVRRPWARWLASRITHRDFWRFDLPLTLSSLVLSLLSFVIAAAGIAGGGALIVAPFLASDDHQVYLFTSGPDHVYSSARQIWWLIPLGLVIVALTMAALTGIGTIRAHVAAALSDSSDEQVEKLTGEIHTLQRGRAGLVDSYEVERSRIERDLHDGTQQKLVALTLLTGQARMIARKISEHPEDHELLETLDSTLAEVQDQTEASLRDLREVVRGIHPAVLTDLGLNAAVLDLASRSGLDVEVEIHGEGTVSVSVAEAVYFALSEALTNVAKHSGTQEARLVMTTDEGGVHATVTDRGNGSSVIHESCGYGLNGMKQRLEAVGGSLRVSSEPGKGTSVHLEAPAKSPYIH